MTWTLLGSLYTCTGTVQFSGDVQEVANITGDHLEGLGDADVHALAISNQLLLRGIPSNVDAFFADLAVLSLSQNGMSSITRRDLSSYTNLQMLIIYNNRIQSIPGDLFLDTPRLQYINLNSNSLRHLGPNIFSNLLNLRTLRLQHNTCIDEYVDNNIAEVVNLEWRATFGCPSSVQQVEDSILNGESFWNIINELRAEVSALEQRVHVLENPPVTETTVTDSTIFTVPGK